MGELLPGFTTFKYILHLVGGLVLQKLRAWLVLIDVNCQV